MPVPTKYHWNISFQKQCSSKYVVKNARNVTQFVWQPFSIEFQGFVKKNTKKHKKKHRQPPSCIVKFLQILCSSCIRLILVILSCLRRRGRRYKRGSDITNFFPKHSYLFCYYHKMNLLYSFIISKILVYIFNFFLTNPWNSIRKRLSHISGIFDNIFRWTFFLERDIRANSFDGSKKIESYVWRKKL
jgi:hypothetical protein